MGNKFKIQSVVLVGISIALGLSEFIIVGIINNISREYATSVSTVGLLVTAFAVIYAISTPILTIYIGSKNLHKAMLNLLGIFGAANFLTALSISYEMLAVSRVITALVSGAIISLSITFSSSIAPREKRAWLVSWVFSGFSVASVFGVPLGTWISDHFSWKVVFVIIAIMTLLLGILFKKYLPSINSDSKIPSLKQQLSIFKDKRIVLGMLLPALNLAGIYVAYTYLKPIIITGFNYPSSWVTPILFIYGLASLISNQASGRLANKGGISKIPLVFLSQSILLILITLTFGLSVLSLVIIILMGLTMYLLNSPIQLFFLDVAEEDHPNSVVIASSLNSIFSNVGIALGSAAGSFSEVHLGLSSLGIVGAIFSVLGLIVILSLKSVQKSGNY